MSEYHLILLLFVVALGLKLLFSHSKESENNQEDRNDKLQRQTKPPKHSSQPVLKNEQNSVFKTEKTLSEKKGAVGEQIIKVLALNQLDSGIYRHFNNLIIPSGQYTTQIDNIIVSPFGIFVIEAKYFAGWIYGQSHQQNWTHTLSRYSKFSFQNPLRQNYKHIKALCALLRLPESQFHSVVVFTHRDCQLKTEFPINVCLVKDFIHYIQSFDKKILDDEKMQQVCGILAQENWQTTPEKLAAHVKQLKPESFS